MKFKSLSFPVNYLNNILPQNTLVLKCPIPDCSGNKRRRSNQRLDALMDVKTGIVINHLVYFL